MADEPVTQKEIEAAKREILGAIKGVETKLLTAFHGWARARAKRTMKR